jgi:Domain of Unknown Function (DUF1080)
MEKRPGASRWSLSGTFLAAGLLAVAPLASSGCATAPSDRAAATSAQPAAGDAAGSLAAANGGAFSPLFNGKDTTGWVQVLDSKWVVEDGALVGRQDPAGRREGESWLITDKDYGDFVLRLKFRISPGGNSGVFVRDPLSRAQRQALADGGQGPWEAGYEVNINNDEPVYPTGSVWAAAKGPGKLQKEGEWNDLLIKLQGQKIWTWVNGQVALDGADLPARSARGGIGFQRHGTPQFRDKVVEFKDIEIREL